MRVPATLKQLQGIAELRRLQEAAAAAAAVAAAGETEVARSALATSERALGELLAGWETSLAAEFEAATRWAGSWRRQKLVSESRRQALDDAKQAEHAQRQVWAIAMSQREVAAKARDHFARREKNKGEDDMVARASEQAALRTWRI